MAFPPEVTVVFGRRQRRAAARALHRAFAPIAPGLPRAAMPVMSSPRVRLAEITGALTLAIDLAFGQSGGVQAGDEHVLRTCLLALRLAEHLDLPEQDREAVCWGGEPPLAGGAGD